ncbi:MAG TPA: recombinase family protein [Gammaproteobacteria bacterium]|nr:recombinase family protein [Gammaproteobacteria bacterium]
MNKTKGVLIGYARVSSQDQDYAGQVAALEEIGCTEVFAERVSGKDKDGRPKLQELLRFARKGDTVHVTKLDRLARNAKDAIEIADQLQAKGAGLVIHDIGGVDINSDVGRLVYTVLAAVAEMERKRIRQRQREGIDRAIAEGRLLGRREVLTPQQKAEIRDLVAAGETKKAIAQRYGVSRTTVYTALGDPQ